MGGGARPPLGHERGGRVIDDDDNDSGATTGPHLVTPPPTHCVDCGVPLDSRGRNKTGRCRACRGLLIARAAETAARLKALEARLAHIALCPVCRMHLALTHDEDQ